MKIYCLPAALKVGIGQIQQRMKQLDGLFIPAHIDRTANGIYSQLGFIPSGLKCDALGISNPVFQKHVVKQYVLQYKTDLIRNSDAHFLKQIGEIYTIFKMRTISFTEIRKSLNHQGNRFCKLP